MWASSVSVEIRHDPVRDGRRGADRVVCRPNGLSKRLAERAAEVRALLTTKIASRAHSITDRDRLDGPQRFEPAHGPASRLGAETLDPDKCGREGRRVAHDSPLAQYRRARWDHDLEERPALSVLAERSEHHRRLRTTAQVAPTLGRGPPQRISLKGADQDRSLGSSRRFILDRSTDRQHGPLAQHCRGHVRESLPQRREERGAM